MGPVTPARLVLVADRFPLDSQLVARRLGDVAHTTTCRPSDLPHRDLGEVSLVLLDASAPVTLLSALVAQPDLGVGLLHDGQVPRDRRADPRVRLVISRDSEAADLRNAVQRVLDGAVHRDATSRNTATEVPSLSPRENDVLGLLARGLANRDIADELAISPHTVRTHVQALLLKLDRGNRVAAVGAARRAGLLPR